MRVVLGEVTDVLLDDRQVRLRPVAGEHAPEFVGYDSVVIAAGSRYNYFGHDRSPREAENPKTLEGALRIRGRVLAAFEAVELGSNPRLRASWLTFAVVGAGPTGVETAGQIAEIARDVRADFRSLDASEARILLVEAGGDVLSGFPPPLPSSTIARSRSSSTARVHGGSRREPSCRRRASSRRCPAIPRPWRSAT